MRTHTIDDIERDLGWLHELETTRDLTQVRLAQREGLSESQMSRRLARARRWMLELRQAARVELERAIAEAEASGRDIPWIEIVQQARSGHHYHLRADQLSDLPGGYFRLGTGDGYLQVVNSSDGEPLNSQTNEPAKFKPKSPKRKKQPVG